MAIALGTYAVIVAGCSGLSGPFAPISIPICVAGANLVAAGMIDNALLDHEECMEACAKKDDEDPEGSNGYLRSNVKTGGAS